MKDAEAKGATFKQAWRREGNLIWPLLIDSVTRDMRIAWEEPFGPVMPVVCSVALLIPRSPHGPHTTHSGIQLASVLH